MSLLELCGFYVAPPPHLFGSYLLICKMGLATRILRSFSTVAVFVFMNVKGGRKAPRCESLLWLLQEILFQQCFFLIFFISTILQGKMFFSGICLYPGVLPCPLLVSSLWGGFIFPQDCSSLADSSNKALPPLYILDPLLLH